MDGVSQVQNIYNQLNEKKTEPKTESSQDAFLKLMTTQLQNQDPFKPMQSGEFLTQIAQFTTATGIGDLKESFNQLTTAMTSNQALQATSLVGKQVLMSAQTAQLGASGGVEGMIDLPQSTTSLKLIIQDEAGQRIRDVPMGMQASGRLAFQWDGYAEDGQRMPEGRYKLSAEAIFDGDVVAIPTLLFARVESVSLGGSAQGVQLNLEGLGTRKLSEVTEVK